MAPVVAPPVEAGALADPGQKGVDIDPPRGVDTDHWKNPEWSTLLRHNELRGQPLREGGPAGCRSAG